MLKFAEFQGNEHSTNITTYIRYCILGPNKQDLFKTSGVFPPCFFSSFCRGSVAFVPCTHWRYQASWLTSERLKVEKERHKLTERQHVTGGLG